MARPPKEVTRRHSADIRLRLMPEHDDLIRRAAEQVAQRRGSGNVSTWLRDVAILAAQEELGESPTGKAKPRKRS